MRERGRTMVSSPGSGGAERWGDPRVRGVLQAFGSSACETCRRSVSRGEADWRQMGLVAGCSLQSASTSAPHTSSSASSIS